MSENESKARITSRMFSQDGATGVYVESKISLNGEELDKRVRAKAQAMGIIAKSQDPITGEPSNKLTPPMNDREINLVIEAIEALVIAEERWRLATEGEALS